MVFFLLGCFVLLFCPCHRVGRKTTLVGHFKTRSSVWNGELAAILLSERGSQWAQTSTWQVFSIIHTLVVPSLYPVIFFFSKHKPSSKRNGFPKGGGLCLSVPWSGVRKEKGAQVTFFSHFRQVSFLLATELATACQFAHLKPRQASFSTL